MEPKRKITDLGLLEGIYCTTEGASKKILALMVSGGLLPAGSYERQWRAYKEKTVYYPKDNTKSCTDYAKELGYTLYPSSDFLTPEISPIPMKQTTPTFFKIISVVHPKTGRDLDLLVRYDGYDDEMKDDNGHIVLVEMFDQVENGGEVDINRRSEMIACASSEMALALIEAFTATMALNWLENQFRSA